MLTFPTGKYRVLCTIPDVLFTFPGQRESGILDPCTHCDSTAMCWCLSSTHKSSFSSSYMIFQLYSNYITHCDTTAMCWCLSSTHKSSFSYSYIIFQLYSDNITHCDTTAMCWCLSSTHKSSFSSSNASFSFISPVVSYL